MTTPSYQTIATIFPLKERFQYIVKASSKEEKTIWVCSQCKKSNMEMVLLGKWKLIDKSDNFVPCDICEPVASEYSGGDRVQHERWGG